MIGDDVFQLGRIDVEAAGDHHVVGAIGRAEVAVRVESPDVAGLHPAVDDSFCRRLGIVPEALHLAVGPGDDRADLPRRDRLVVVVPDLKLGERQRHAASAEGCEPETSLANYWRGPIIATGSTSVCP